jgi:acetyltransferase-like isoleucine patch superfamily enzyme
VDVESSSLFARSIFLSQCERKPRRSQRRRRVEYKTFIFAGFSPCLNKARRFDPVMQASDYFALPKSLSAFESYFAGNALPWEWLLRIGPALESWKFDGSQPVPPGVHVEGKVYLHPTVKLPPYAVISGPVWIGPETVIRPGALIRQNVIVGKGCVLGNSCEYKNCLLLDDVETPHFNYVGDSVLGNGAHLAAGAICSNLRLDRKSIVVRAPDRDYETGLRKFGAIVGDHAEVGCNAVLNPGTLLGPRSLVMPAVAFGGVLAPATIAKGQRSRATVLRTD